jgi:two-component system, NtrC family, sensor histidine kinase HydH
MQPRFSGSEATGMLPVFSDANRRAFAWENSETMPTPLADLRSMSWKTAYIAIVILLLAVATWFTPPHAVELHNILHHLNFLPLMIAGMVFGWRGALAALVFAAVVQAPSIARHWTSWPMDAQDQIVELSIFGAAGMIAGFLSDGERVQRMRVETTKAELEHVYIELRQKIEQMKKAERLSAVGQLAASLAHEIRNPLASISGAAGILKRGNATADNTDECLGILEKESQRLNKLLTNFLDFARPRLPRYQQVNAGSLIESVASIARHAAILHDVELLVDQSMSVRTIECDPEQLKQVLLNLILNAVQATEGHGTVHIRSHDQADRIFIEVCDEGTGIMPDQQEKIFDPFFTTKENGTGLGLAIAANIVEQHGGSLTGENNSGKGMTFCIELPVHQPSKPGEMATVR